MKHEPYEEFVDACYQFTDEDKAPTRLWMKGSAFHGAMASVAIDMVGAKKAQIGRLTNVPIEKVAIFGVPKIWCTIVRSSDMARTPDVRTLPILPKWACTIDVRFVGSLIKAASIGNLLGAAGVIVGIGDGRPEKGKLSMGNSSLSLTMILNSYKSERRAASRHRMLLCVIRFHMIWKRKNYWLGSTQSAVAVRLRLRRNQKQSASRLMLPSLSLPRKTAAKKQPPKCYRAREIASGIFGTR